MGRFEGFSIMEDKVIKLTYTDGDKYAIRVNKAYFKNEKQMEKSIKLFISRLGSSQYNDYIIKINDYFPDDSFDETFISTYGVRCIQVTTFEKWKKEQQEAQQNAQDQIIKDILEDMKQSTVKETTEESKPKKKSKKED